MKSMTGYGYQEKHDNDISVSVEIKGYNSRFLELMLYLPSQISSLDMEIRRFFSERCRRGKIEVNVYIKEHNAALSVSVNQEAVKAYFESFLAIYESLHTARASAIEKNIHWNGNAPSIAEVMRFEGVVEIEKNRNAEDYGERIKDVLTVAFEQFDTARAREGKHTETDILSHIETIETRVKNISAHVPELEASIKENIKKRFTELLSFESIRASHIPIDENRILAETAMLLMKYTIAEEVSRLSVHLAEFRAETERNPSPGKKLDFLCQEINREINTIGSKSQFVEVSRAVVDIKDALENIREQLRNVE